MRIRREKKYCSGQVMVEFALMAVTCVTLALSLYFLLVIFSEYGSRLIGLVAWEPDPPDRSQMQQIINGTL